MNGNKTIAKNTIFLYLRMLVTMFIALYTSRVVLQRLGVDDFGIYQAVGGIVGLLSFINSALATGTSRFLTYELGKGDIIKLRNTFATSFSAHLILAFIIIIVAETIGLWFVCNKMSFAIERYNAAIITYHISIFSIIFTLIQVPLNAAIIAHEKMSFYAYISIFEAVSKLLICYLLGFGNIDKLIFYAILLFVIHLLLFLIYAIYCTRKFEECIIKLLFDKSILRPIMSFSGWSLFANGSFVMANQGILVLLNLFFAPAVVTARAVSIQVINATNQLVNNFRTAANPQIVKYYAVGNYLESKKLLLMSTQFSFFLMLVVALPVFYLAEPLLHLWLGDNVPNYTAIFMKIGIIQSLFQVFDTSFYTALYAKGDLKANALISPTVIFLVFPIIYVLFKMGYSPVALSWAYLFVFALLGLVIKPILIIKIVNYSWSDIIKVIIPCSLTGIIAMVISYYVDKAFKSHSIGCLITELLLLIFIGCIVSYFIGLDRQMRHQLNTALLSKIRKFKIMT